MFLGLLLITDIWSLVHDLLFIFNLGLGFLFLSSFILKLCYITSSLTAGKLPTQRSTFLLWFLSINVLWSLIKRDFFINRYRFPFGPFFTIFWYFPYLLHSLLFLSSPCYDRKYNKERKFPEPHFSNPKYEVLTKSQMIYQKINRRIA